MATQLRDTMSSEAHISYAERHERLGLQTKGAESLVTNIRTPIEKLKIQVNIRLEKVKARYTAYDSVVLHDGILDDTIRNLADSAKQYDRSNPGRPVFQLLFPDGKFSTVTDAPYAQEPDKAEQVLLRLKSFEEGHSLLSHVEPLTKAIADSRAAIAAHQTAVTDEKAAIAEEELAQAELRKQYEFNYLDAVKLFGKNHANRLFPKLSNGKKKVKEEIPSEA